MPRFLDIPFYQGQLRVALTVDGFTKYLKVDVLNMVERSVNRFMFLPPSNQYKSTIVFTWKRFAVEVMRRSIKPNTPLSVFADWGIVTEDPWNETVSPDTETSLAVFQPYPHFRIEQKRVKNLSIEQVASGSVEYIHVTYLTERKRYNENRN